MKAYIRAGNWYIVVNTILISLLILIVASSGIVSGYTLPIIVVAGYSVFLHSQISIKFTPQSLGFLLSTNTTKHDIINDTIFVLAPYYIVITAVVTFGFYVSSKISFLTSLLLVDLSHVFVMASLSAIVSIITTTRALLVKKPYKVWEYAIPWVTLALYMIVLASQGLPLQILGATVLIAVCYYMYKRIEPAFAAHDVN